LTFAVAKCTLVLLLKSARSYHLCFVSNCMGTTLTRLNTGTPADIRRACELSVVIPCLNEAETLAICIQKAQKAMLEAGIDGEVVVADNGSTDGSREIAIENGAFLVSVPIRGYGAALAAGFQAAHGRYLIMADGDDSYNFAHIPRFLASLRGGADLVMGNRFRGGIEPGAMPVLHRYLGNPVLSFLGRVIFQAKCGDFHCGMRGLTRKAFDRLELRTPGMEFASEMVVKAALKGLRIEEVPTTLSPDGRSRAPHLRTWRDGWRHLRFLLLYSPKWLFLYPGLTLMCLGLIATALLEPGELHLGSVNFDVDTLTYALAAVMIGYQTVIFGVAAKTFGVSIGILPEHHPWVERALNFASLETGTIIGVLLTVLGIVGSIMGVHLWHQTGFGRLNPGLALRVSLPSATAIILGVETVMASWFLGVLRLARIENPRQSRASE
jgi:glycosyltransferase involved in cell wall biosynthesis